MKDYYVYVCNSCNTASCWNGEFFCDNYLDAGIHKTTASKLRELNLEHQDNFSRERLTEIYGVVEDVDD
jgi:hypothetical protein